MNSWDRHLTRLYAFTFCWISISVYAIYVCTDFLFKHQRFMEHREWIMEYYLLRSAPFYIICMPVVAFLSLIIVAYQLRRRHEWHIVKLVCTSNGRITKALFICGAVLCLGWIVCREGFLPRINGMLEESYHKVKGSEDKAHMVYSEGEYVAFVQSLSPTFKHIRITLFTGRANGTHDVSYPGEFFWDSNFGLWKGQLDQIHDSNLLNHLVPSPVTMAIRNKDYVTSSSRELLLSYAEHPRDPIIRMAIAERVLQPALFILYFLLAAYDVLRCRHDHLIWLFPAVGLFMFSFSIMLFKPAGMEVGVLASSAICAALWLATQRGFSLYFRRHGRSN